MRALLVGTCCGVQRNLLEASRLRIRTAQPHSKRGLVYSASGYNKGKELLKSSFHLATGANLELE